MKKALTLMALVALLAPGLAFAGSLGIGAFGGTSIPLVQDDNGSGTMFGVRVPVQVHPLLAIEPFFATASGGDADQDVLGVTYTRSGIDVTSFGATAMLTFGDAFRFYPYAGISSNQLKRDGLDDTQTGYVFGLGLGFNLPYPGLSLHVRGGLDAVTDPASSEASRKWADVSGGLSYNLFHFPKQK